MLVLVPVSCCDLVLGSVLQLAGTRKDSREFRRCWIAGSDIVFCFSGERVARIFDISIFVKSGQVGKQNCGPKLANASSGFCHFFLSALHYLIFTTSGNLIVGIFRFLVNENE